MALLRGFVENNLYIVAGIALGVAVAQLLGNGNHISFHSTRIMNQKCINNYIVLKIILFIIFQ